MSDPLRDIGWLIAILYGLEAMLLLAHALRRWAGLIPICLFIAAMVYFMMLTDPVRPRVFVSENLTLPTNSLTVFPAALFGVLLIYITEGKRPTWILFACLLLVYGLVLATAAMVQGWLRWPGLAMAVKPPADLFPFSIAAQARSAAAFAAAVVVIIGLFTLLSRRVPRLPVWMAVCVAFAAGMLVDGIVYPLTAFEPPSLQMGHMAGKLTVAVLMSLPLILYLRRFSPQWLREEVRGADHFDLFSASGDLEHSLPMSERRFRQIIDQTRTAIVGFSRRGRVILWNRAAEAIYDTPAAKAIERPAAEFLSDDDVENLRRIRQIVAEVFEGKASEGEMEITRECGGEQRHLVEDLFPLRGSEGEVLFGVATVHDVTEARRAERDLARAKESLEIIIDSIHEGMAGLDRDGTIQIWSREAARLTGLSAEQVVGQRAGEALPRLLGAPDCAKAIERALRVQEEATLEGVVGPGAPEGGYLLRFIPHSRGVTVFFR